MTVSTNHGTWARRSTLYDLFEASELRRGPYKRRLFARATGQTLLVAVGTGTDLPYLPAVDAVGVDYSPAMLTRARRRVGEGPARVRLLCADAAALPFPDRAFETVITSCTMCSLPDVSEALSELRRVLVPGGRLLMFEHVRSRNWALGLVLDTMTLWSRRSGTHMNRDTITAVKRAGFAVRHIDSVFLDVIIAVDAERPR